MNLKEEINNIKIIDQHCHALDSWDWKKSTGSYPFESYFTNLPKPTPLTTTSLKRNMLTTYREVYDFTHSELTPDNQKELDDVYQKSRGEEESAFIHKAMDRAGIEGAVNMCMSGPSLPPGLKSEVMARAQLVDGFLIPLDNSDLRVPPIAKHFIKMIEIFPNTVRREMQPKSFDDYLNMVSATLEKLVEDGVAALKMNHAYWRDIAIDVVSKEDAMAVYDQKDTSPVNYKLLQDYIMRHMIGKAATLGLPIHMHTGSYAIPQPMDNGNPSRFDPFLCLPDIIPAKMILLHGGWPFFRESGFMVSRASAPNLYLDISMIPWAHPSAPEGYVAILRDWLQNGLAPKMLYGSDGVNPYTIFISAISIREGLYLALKGMIDDGYINEKQALAMARMILRENALNLYKGKLLAS